VSEPRWVVGIDLGTTHSALAARRIEDATADSEIFEVPQLVARGTIEARKLLPSFVYFAHESEGALSLPWDRGRAFAVGELARARSAEAPMRVVSSAKSWLSQSSIDRRAALLPIGAPDDVEKISPVEASFRVLDHLVESWQHARELAGESAALAEQEVFLTVPASFDAAARDLTVEAALAAGLDAVTLLEEPQAALYSWIETSGDFSRLLQPGDVVLVVDVGGGTTDFSAIVALDQDGALELHRVAVGDHILLGGDNMDLTLAHVIARKLAEQGHELDRWQMAALTHGCRSAKERMLSDGAPASVPIVVASRGSQLLGSSLRTELTRDEVESVLLDGFFPVVEASARPAARARAGLTQLGLAYAADPGITRHLAQFLSRQAGALEALGFAGKSGAKLLHPTAVLFNGGVTKAPALRARILSALNSWLESDGAPPARVLSGEDPDLAVARGAAYYGLVRRGRGLRIRGGTAQAYYVGIESPAPAVPGVEPPIVALCVAPFGMEEGSLPQPVAHELGLVVGEPVRFRFFGSSVRRTDAAGAEIERWAAGEIVELAPVEISLPAEGRREGDLVPVRVEASITPVGTLLLEAVPAEPVRADERWKIELSVRE
jgi:molecular chaperone DnaK (HSP70)